MSANLFKIRVCEKIENTMKVYFFILAIIASAFKIEAQSINDWENPDINGINKEKPHAYGFLSEEKATNSMVRSLNGIWKFKWSPNPASRPMNFYTENYLGFVHLDCIKILLRCYL